MVKIVSSMTRSLQQENEALKMENAQLKEEIQRLEAAYKQVWKGASPLSILSATKLTHKEVVAADDRPSYLRPTAGSNRRSVTVARASVELTSALLRKSIVRPGKTALRYEDGRLIGGPEDRAIPGFLRHTVSSALAAGVDSCSAQAGIRCQDDPLVVTKNYRSLHAEDAIKSEDESVPYDLAVPIASEASDADPERRELICTECEKNEAEYISTDGDTLRRRTRLDDRAFYETPESRCCVPFKIQARVLKSALQLAQETLWCALRHHWPKVQLEKYPECPASVEFGRDRLSSLFGGVDDQPPSEALRLCGGTNHSAATYMYNVVYLRNAVCHPRHRTAEDIDALIEHAQGLAVAVGDEARSRKLRKLRDALIAEVQKAHAEIEAFEPFAHLPYARQWPVHHQLLFSGVSRRLGDSDGHFTYGVVGVADCVKRAARAWALKYCRPGEMQPQYLRNLERAKGFLRETEYGRRASVSAEIPPGGLRDGAARRNCFTSPDDKRVENEDMLLPEDIAPAAKQSCEEKRPDFDGQTWPAITANASVASASDW